MTAHKVKLTELLAELVERTQINLSIVGDVKRNITLRIDDRTVSELLKRMAQMTGYTYR